MGVRHIIKGVDASSLGVGYSPLIPNGLKFINFFGGSFKANKNLYGAASQIVGTPVDKGMKYGVACDTSNKIQTAVDRPTKGTIIGVFCPNSNAVRAYCISDASALRPIGLSIYADPTATAGVFNLIMVLGYANAAGDAIANVIQASDVNKDSMVAFAATFDSSAQSVLTIKLINLTKNKTTISSKTDVVTHALKSNKLFIGAGADATITSSSDVAMAAVWDRILTDDEINKQYAQIKTYYQNIHGVSI